jgi:hypothetical protein
VFSSATVFIQMWTSAIISYKLFWVCSHEHLSVMIFIFFW